MDENVLPKRKQIRMKDYDYSTPGAYFVTVCTANREKIFWSDRRGELCSPADNVQTGWSDRRGELCSPADNVQTGRSDRRGELCSPADNINTGDQRSPLRVELSDVGKIVDVEIQKMNTVYDAVRVDKYCIMPDHIHFILSIDTDENGRTQFAPTISRVMKQFKGSITKQVGRPIWQKSFYDHGIRNQQDYDEIWAYIENNPLKYALNRTP